MTLLDSQGAPALGTSTTAAWDFKSGDKYAVLRHHSTSLVIALSHTSNGWLRLREGDGKESQVMWTSGNRSGQAFDAGEIQILDDLKKRPGAAPLESRFGGAAEVKLGNWRLVRAGDGVDEVKMYNQSSLNVLRLDPWGVRIVGGSGDGGRLGSGVPQATAPRQFRVGDQVRMIAVPELECGSNIVAGDLCVIDEVDRSDTKHPYKIRNVKTSMRAHCSSSKFEGALAAQWPVGSKVHVSGYGNATVEGHPPSGEHAGKIKVRYDEGSTYHVTPEQLTSSTGTFSLKCSRGHVMVRDARGLNSCDLNCSPDCRRHGTAWRCSGGCDYDVCEPCWVHAQAAAVEAAAEVAPPLVSRASTGAPTATTAWDLSSSGRYAVLRHHTTALVVALSFSSNGWLRIREDDGREFVMWTSGSRSPQNFDPLETELASALEQAPGTEPLERRFADANAAGEVTLGNWRLVRAADGADEVHLCNHSQTSVLRLDPWGRASSAARRTARASDRGAAAALRRPRHRGAAAPTPAAARWARGRSWARRRSRAPS